MRLADGMTDAIHGVVLTVNGELRKCPLGWLFCARRERQLPQLELEQLFIAA
jgi:hypothetical protein